MLGRLINKIFGSKKNKSAENANEPIAVFGDLDKPEEPFFILKSANYTDERGFEIDCDWNEAFVSKLRSSGYVGNDSSVIRAYLMKINDIVIDELRETGGDFE